VFIGTTNPESSNAYMKDTTGGRRFWPVTVGNIDLDGLRRDLDQLFAEAVRAFVAGEKWWPDRDFEREHIMPEQEARTEVSMWLEKIETYLRTETAGLPVTVHELAEHVMRIPSDRLATALTPKLQGEIGACLRKLGWLQHRSEYKRRWEPGPNWQPEEK
jgi:predicted P-loop ATPase